MYFDRRLWDATKGLRWRIALGVVIGLLAAVAGLSRFALMGMLLAKVFADAPVEDLFLPALSVASAVLLRGILEIGRAHV